MSKDKKRRSQEKGKVRKKERHGGGPLGSTLMGSKKETRRNEDEICLFVGFLLIQLSVIAVEDHEKIKSIIVNELNSVKLKRMFPCYPR